MVALAQPAGQRAYHGLLACAPIGCLCAGGRLHHSPQSTSDQRGPEVIINFVRIVASLSVPVRDR